MSVNAFGYRLQHVVEDFGRVAAFSMEYSPLT